MQHRYGVSVQVLHDGDYKQYLVGQGKDVLTFARNHPYLHAVYGDFKRFGKVRIKRGLVTISPSASSSVIQTNHEKKEVLPPSPSPALPSLLLLL